MSPSTFLAIFSMLYIGFGCYINDNKVIIVGAMALFIARGIAFFKERI